MEYSTKDGWKVIQDCELDLGRRPTQRLPVASATGKNATITLRPEAGTIGTRTVSKRPRRNGDNFRFDSVFSERIPCTGSETSCALVLANQESLQEAVIESINFGIDPGTGSIPAIGRAWKALSSWI